MDTSGDPEQYGRGGEAFDLAALKKKEWARAKQL